MSRPARWIYPPALPQDLQHASLAERVFWARGHSEKSSVRKFLHPAIEHMHDPRGLADMEQAVDRLCRAIRDREPILLYGDYDVDGTTSIVVLKTTLQLAGAYVDYHVPHRVIEGYGMRPEVIDSAAASRRETRCQCRYGHSRAGSCRAREARRHRCDRYRSSPA